MDLKEIMQQQSFAVAGDTVRPHKYAAQIKQGLIEHGYTVYAVGKELASFNDIDGEIDIIDLCINPMQGLALMRECKKPFKCIVIQPGAESDELLAFLDEHRLPYIQGCLLVGLSVYAKDQTQ